MFCIRTDASRIAIGVMLAQNPTRKIDQPMPYASCIPTPTKKNYSTIEWEALAMSACREKIPTLFAQFFFSNF